MNLTKIAVLERQAELAQLRAKIEFAEQSRLSGEKTFTPDESQRRLESIYARAKADDPAR